MRPSLIALVAGAHFVGISAFLEMGRRIGIRRKSRPGAESGTGFGALEGAVFGLMGLLIAFTFSGAASRFDARRRLIVQEANNIGTAYLRLDLLPAAAQPGLREDFRKYLDSRLAFYGKLSQDLAAASAEVDHSKEMQGRIWSAAVAACRSAELPGTCSLVLPSVNDMIDITTTREAALRDHPPLAINAIMVLLVLTSSLLAGYDLADIKSRSWLHMLVYAAALSAAIYIILDYEYPRLGLIRIDPEDRMLIDLRNSMK